MIRILHISDLHFGRIHPPAIESLQQVLLRQEKKIDLIVMTGDWTQRARLSQFKEAANFIAQVQAPILTVPGNHDIPLYNVMMRWFAPFYQYNRYIDPHTKSVFLSDKLVIVGVSTVHPRRAVEGTLTVKDVDRVQKYFSQASPAAVKVIACHHPIVEPSGKIELRPESLAHRILDLKPDIILSGHSHLHRVESVATKNGNSVLHISAGSALSSRLRGEANNFHILEFSQGNLTVETFFLSENGFITREVPPGQSSATQVFHFETSRSETLIKS